MATTYCNELSGIASFPQVQGSGGLQGSRRHCYRATINLASQLSGSIIVLAQVPAGHTYEGVKFLTDTSLGSTTFGITGQQSGNTYLATGTTLTATNTPTSPLTVAASQLATLTANDQVVLTTAAATMPSSGILVIYLFFLCP